MPSKRSRRHADRRAARAVADALMNVCGCALCRAIESARRASEIANAK